MTRQQIEKAAADYASGLPLDWFWVNFAIQQVNAAREEDAQIVETKALARYPNHDTGLNKRRKGQPSLAAIEIAKEIRALKIED